MLRLILLSAIGLLLSTHTATACSCKTLPPPDKAMAQAHAVFLGKVTAIEVPPLGSGGPIKVMFSVETSYKGVKTKKVEVQTAIDSGACGYRFTKGEVYLVYCSSGDKKTLRTGSCHRTRPASSAAADLKALGDGEEPGK